jgi:folate-binding protein YgfZ
MSILQEYEALRRGAGLIDFSAWGLLRLRGKDRARFLHNMLTNDILKLRPGEGCNAVKVSVQGRMEAALRVLCLEDEMWCDTEGEALAGVALGLRKRIVLENAALEDASAGWRLLAVPGPEARRVLERCGIEPPAAMHGHAAAALAGAEVRVVRSDHTGDGGCDIWATAAAAANVAAALRDAGAVAVGEATYELRRIESGIPRHGREITSEHFPQEANLDAGWISYTKGCYLGQETISRLHHMGHVNRSLCGLVVDGDAVPEPGTSLAAGGKEGGRITSSVRSLVLDRPVALAYVRHEIAAPGTAVELANGSTARIADLPFA